MSRRAKLHLIISGLVFVLAFILNWLIIGDTSPLGEYFLWHVGLPNAWRGMNMIPGMISALAAGNLHGGNEIVFYLAFAIQWLLIGLLLSFVALLFRMKREKPPTLFE